ncbi:hypothetical protein BDZ97DRAFT_738651 [Flammula alnicola]|nr:hypothetical protein BDZ97DRAFT_738651 [Flammula alnicola]
MAPGPTLSSDYDPNKCLLSAGGPCQACLKLVTLDAQISHPQSSIIDLRTKRRLLKTNINYQHDPLIHRFPVEIAAQVFIFYVEEIIHHFRVDSTPESELSAPLQILGSVCHTWRTPQLWSTINVHLYSISSIPLHIDMARRWLNRSAQLPLSISLSFSDSYAIQMVSPLFVLIREHAPRWRQLNLRIRTIYYEKLIGGLDILPSLQKIVLYPPSESTWTSTEDFCTGKTPCLEHLEASNIILAKVHVQWSALTSFDATGIYLADILGLLRWSH